MKSHLIIVFICAAAQFSFAQAQSIHFANPSFEDFARAGRVPIDWYDCGFPNETPPDVQPDPTFDVSKETYDGGTYLGMVVRDNNTWESVSQGMSETLKEGACYQFEIYLARSLTYMSVSRISNKVANYVTPVKLRVWGGVGHCDKAQLLHETKLVTHTEWKPYLIQFEARKAYTHITFEAYYDDPNLSPYNGNLLLDYLSEIEPLDCDASWTRARLKQKRVAIKPAPPPPPVNIFQPKKLEAPKKSQAPKKPEVMLMPISETELLQIVETSAGRITFNSFGTVIVSPYNNPQTNTETLVNLPLQSILDGLQQHRLTMLIIAITEKDPELAERKRESLKTILQNMGARQEQVIIRSWLDKDAEKTWYGNEDNGVLLRLIR